MQYTSSRSVLNALMAGTAIQEVQNVLQGLRIGERYAVLCTACYRRDERVAADCLELAHEISELLTRNCPFYFHGQRTCKHPLVRIIEN